MNETRQFIEEISRLNTEIRVLKQENSELSTKLQELPKTLLDSIPQNLQRMANALAVFILDSKLYNWLKANDPKALEQAINAVNGYDPKIIEGKIPQPTPSTFVYALVPEAEPGKRIVTIDYKQAGKLPTGIDHPSDSLEAAQSSVDYLNAQLGVSQEVVDAFLAGSMFGWHVPAAKPAHDYFKPAIGR